MIALLALLLLSTAGLSHSEICGGYDCGGASCCIEQQSRVACYDPGLYSCQQTPRGGFLCPKGNMACSGGSNQQPLCYDPQLYNCVDGGLQQKPAGSPTTTASPPLPDPTTTRAPSTTTTTTTRPLPTTTTTRAPSNSGACGTNSVNCGGQSCCLSPSGAGQCYVPSSYSCFDGTLCPLGYSGCGSACYHPSQYSCVNGQLQATGGAGSSTGSGGSPSTSSPTTSSPSTTGSSGGNQVPVKLWGINYSPKRPSGACPSLADVEADLRVLEKIAYRIRLYSLVDCNQGQLVLQALQNTGANLTVTLGIWLDRYYYAEFPNEYGALLNILSSGLRLNKVDDFIVGSETQYRADFDWSILVGYMQNISSTLSIYGYANIDVVTSDVIYNLLGSPILNYENVVYVNQFPFWEGEAVGSSPQLLSRTVASLRANVGNKPIVIGETGWPTSGDQLGASVPTAANLNFYLQAVVCSLNQQGVGYFWFSAFDEPFREDKQGGVERYFGVYNADRTPKAGVNLPVMCPM